MDPAYPGSLRPGDWVQITGTDSCLNMRWDPRIPAPAPDGTVIDNVMNCLPDGFIGRLDAFNWGKTTVPVQVDGRWWWHIVGQGWAAEEFLRLHHQGGIPWPERPDLVGAGSIAYLGKDGGVWLMNADGSEQRQIWVGGVANQWVQPPHWSPHGDALAFSTHRSDGVMVTLVVDVNGTVVAEFGGLAEPRWSPDAGRLSAIRGTPTGMGGYQGTPVVVDLATGAETAIGPHTYYSASPAWSPVGDSLAFICISNYISQPDGSTVVDPNNSCGGDGLRISAANGSASWLALSMDPTADVFLYNPSWSPSGGTIAVWSMKEGAPCRGYALVDVASSVVSSCAPHPPVAAYIGGRCGGGSEMGASSWTADGRLVFTAQGSGQSGVFIHDPATGARALIPSMNAGAASLASSGSTLTFAGGGHVWVAGTDGSNLTLLAEGHSPAWQPLP
jgi:Tol biopolymer transport system component